MKDFPSSNIYVSRSATDYIRSIIENNLKPLIMILTITCIAILICWLKGEDIKPKLDELRNTDWKKGARKLFTKVKISAKRIGREACGDALKLWYVLQDSETTMLEKALICGAILYIVSKNDIISANVYKLLGWVDDGLAAAYVINKVKEKMTPAIENKVKDVLDEWFGPEYSVSDARA